MAREMQEFEFGCAITNRFQSFGLLGEDSESDPFELLKQPKIKTAAPVPGTAKTEQQEVKEKSPLSDKKEEETQAPVSVKKDGDQRPRMGNRPEGEGPRPRMGGRYEGPKPRTGDRYEGLKPRTGDRYEGSKPRMGGRYEGPKPRMGSRPEGEGPMPRIGHRTEGEGHRTEGEGRRPEGEGRRPEGEGRRPRTGGRSEGEGPGEAHHPPDRSPSRRAASEIPAGEGAEKAEGGGEFSVVKPVGERSMRGRGGARGGRGGRGRGGTGRMDGFDSRSRQEFDRHIGSDKSRKDEKRGGSGSHNEDTGKDDMNQVEEHPAADTKNKDNEVEVKKEEGPKEMSLDEYKAKQEKERAKMEFNIRKVTGGADSTKVLHGKKASTLSDEEPPKAEDEHHVRKTVKKDKKLEINFGVSGHRGRGRGEAREPRDRIPARMPRGGGRSDRTSGLSVPNVDDPEAFPALPSLGQGLDESV